MKRFSLIVIVLFIVLQSDAVFSQDFVYSIRNKRDPFFPLVSIDGRIINLDARTEISDLHLEGIIFDPQGKSFAVINGNVISEGELVAGFKVAEIKKDKIILQNEENTHIIELTKEEESEK